MSAGTQKILLISTKAQNFTPIAVQARISHIYQHRATAWVVLTLSLLLTGAAWHLTESAVKANAKERFEFQTQDLTAMINKRLEGYETALRAGAGFFHGSQEVTRAEWHHYVASLRVQKILPSIQGMGFSLMLPPEDVEAHIAEIRSEGFKNYSIHPDGIRNPTSTVVFMEPFDRCNRQNFGYDMFSEPVRREAMIQAMETGEPAVSGRVTLLQDRGKCAANGFLMFVPVYHKSKPLQTPEERRAAILGFVFSPLRAADLMRGIIDSEKMGITFEIHDGTTPSNNTLIYDHSPSPAAPRPGTVKKWPEDDFSKLIPLEICMRPWTIFVQTTKNHRPPAEHHLPMLVAGSGAAINLFLFLIIASLSRAKRRIETTDSQIRKLLLAVEQSPHGIIITDTNACVEYANPAFSRLTGFTLPEILGKNLRMLQSGQTPKETYQDLWQTLRRGEVWRGEFINRHKNGGIYTEHAIISPVVQPNGNITHYLAIKEDITLRKEMEIELKTAKERWEFALEGGKLGVWDWHLPSNTVYFSPRWKRILGFADDEIAPVLDEWESRVHPDDIERVMAAIQEHILGITPVYEAEHRLRGKDGNYISVMDRGMIVSYSDDGKPLRMIGTHTDVSPLKRAECAARDSEATTRGIMNSLQASIALIDQDGTIIEVNQIWREFGLSNNAPEMLCLGIDINYITACERAADSGDPHAVQALAGIRSVLNGEKQVFHMDYPCHSPNENRWFQFTASVLQTDHQKIVITHTDITSLKSALLGMARYADMVNYTAMPLILIDLDLCYVATNQAYAALRGISLEDLIGKRVSDVIEPSLFAQEEADLKRCLAGEPQKKHYIHTLPDGSRRDYETSLYPHRSGNDIIGIVVGIHDVTELVNARKVLEAHQDHLERLVDERSSAALAAEEQLRLILESSADGIFVANIRGEITFANPAAERLLGYSLVDMLGREMHTILHSNHEKYVIHHQSDCPLSRCLAENKTIRVADDVFWRIDGTPLPVSYAAHPMLRQECTVGLVVNFADNTTNKQTELALEQARQNAEHLAKVKSDFLAMMSHEIRTPLNGVLGLAQIGMRECGSSRSAVDTFSHILESGRLLLGIINQILDFSKIDAGKLVIEAVPFDPRQIVHDTIAVIREPLQEKSLILESIIGESFPHTCLGDPIRVSQVLLNLLSNAVKFTEDGSIRLEAVLEDENMVFRITDTGIGMTPEHLACLFRPFEQGDTSITRKYGGTGLGLSISRYLVELMGGKIRVESRPSVGTCFELRLPYRPTELPVYEHHLSHTLPPATSKRLTGIRILAVEDNAVNQLVIEAILTSEGAEVTLAGNGLLAVESVTRTPDAYDIVLMDVQMPELDGREATRRILAIAPSLPVIGQTAHVLTDEHEACQKAGMIKIISKPFDHEHLVMVILQQYQMAHPQRQLGIVKRESNPCASPSTSLVDWEKLKTTHASRPGFLRKLLELALSSNTKTAAELRAAAESEDLAQLHSLAHNIKGMAGNFFAATLEERARLLEAATLSHSLSNSPEIPALTEQLALRFDGFLLECRHHLSNSETPQLPPDSSSGTSCPFKSKIMHDPTPNDQATAKEAIYHDAMPVFRANILLAEDDETTAQLEKMMIEELGIHVDLAQNGGEALDKAISNFYDLIFLDHRMPVKTGLQVSRELRSSPHARSSQVPIIALIADSPADKYEEFHQAGINAIIEKPLNTEELIQTLETYLPSN